MNFIVKKSLECVQGGKGSKEAQNFAHLLYGRSLTCPYLYITITEDVLRGSF